LLKHQQPFIFPPVAEIPIASNLSSVFPMLKHHCSAFFISFHPVIFFSPPPLPKQLRPTIVSPLSVAETPFISNPSFFSPPPSMKQFRPAIVSPLPVAETLFASNPSSFLHDAETPPFSTLCFSSDTETPVISSSSPITIVRFFSVAETPAFYHHPSASFHAPK
jgi:hypothetical protein